ncbi:MAG: metallophosphoesterase family protein [Chloroflexi bacterium]|nr:metallophosphoesterase family protein [Chloroflexota bacterium]MBI2983828.1 metallophosphoesterase family protein [Chloroflexota bacterium]
MSTIALLSDIHANLVALEAVLAALGRVDRIWVMGDTVGYGPDPSDVLALLRERDAIVVAGNHDLAAATGEGLGMFNPYAAAAVRMHRSWLSAEERDHLASLPLTLETEGFTLCHGSLRDPLWEYVMSGGQAAATLRLAKTAHCCNGHTHIPAAFRSTAADATRSAAGAYELLAAKPLVASQVGITTDLSLPLTGRLLVNPGSVGQPRDGDPRAAYAVADTDARTVAFRRAPYDVAATQQRIRSRGLPGMLADRLAIGF